MSDSESENYFTSDDENNINNNSGEENDEDDDEENKENMTFDELYPEEEMDEETWRIVMANNDTKELEIDESVGEKKTKRVRKKKEKKTLNLVDFHKKIEDSKPKKWSSNRLKSRKNLENKKDVTTRQFNPRNPPRPRRYNRNNNRNNGGDNKDNFNKKNFPKLK